MQDLRSIFNCVISKIKIESRSIKFNIGVSFLAKGISVASSFITVPLLLNYLDDERYGVWLTLASILQWISLFDLGLGNGLRNKFAIAKANSDYKLAADFVSTSYFIVGILSFLFIVSFVLIYFLFDLSKLVNSPGYLSYEVNLTLLILGCLQSVKFTLDIINYLLLSDQRVGLSNLIASLASIFIPLGYFVYALFFRLSLIQLSFIYLLVPILILSFVSVYFFRGSYYLFRPNIMNVKKSIIKDILNLGVRFFIIQISALIIFTSDNIIISNLFGPKEVIPYNIAFRYFSVINFLFIIIITPIWGAFTKEYELGNFPWIKTTLRKLLVIWFCLTMISIGMLSFSNLFFRFWINNEVKIPFLLSLNMMIFTIISNWNNIFAFFLNGVSKIKLQLITGVIAGVINVPLSILLAKDYELGPTGVIMATSLSLLIGSVLQPIQTLKIIEGRAFGIWAK